MMKHSSLEDIEFLCGDLIDDGQALNGLMSLEVLILSQNIYTCQFLRAFLRVTGQLQGQAVRLT